MRSSPQAHSRGAAPTGAHSYTGVASAMDSDASCFANVPWLLAYMLV